MTASRAYELPDYCAISDFRSGAKEFCALLAPYGAQNGNLLSKFRGKTIDTIFKGHPC
jgi:hypothetical protein